jgi:hypothetical protein
MEYLDQHWLGLDHTYLAILSRLQLVKQFPAFFIYGLEFPRDLCWDHVFTACFQNLLLKYADAMTCAITLC